MAKAKEEMGLTSKVWVAGRGGGKCRGGLGHTIPMGSASASPHLVSSSSQCCAHPLGRGLPCNLPPALAALQESSLLYCSRLQSASRARSAKPVACASLGGWDPPALPSWGPCFVSGGARDALPLVSCWSPGPALLLAWGDALGTGQGIGGSPPVLFGAAFPKQQRGCSGRTGSSKPWREAGSLGTAQRVSPSTAAEAITLSIQATYGAMRV